MKFFKRTLLFNELGSTTVIIVNGNCKADGG